ncbi:MAG: porin [Prolixibacteraceae bacterium]
MKQLLVAIMLFCSFTLTAQDNTYKNSADNLLIKDSKLTIGGYGEAHYNKSLDGDNYSNAKLDVHRLVMLLGYNFSDRVKFVSELEFEHVKEVYVEQAFLQFKLNEYINFRGGLMLTPMGIINEYHEPTTFNGVERPLVDKYLAPTTWRELGFGVSGNIISSSIKYQAYIMGGFNGYDGSAKFSGSNGLRKGRQKGAEAFSTTPAFTGKVEYYGIKGLNVGLSTYIGKTSTTLYDGLSKEDEVAKAQADSSVVGIAMVGTDFRYRNNGLILRGQFYYNSLSNTDEYNQFTAKDGKNNDLGKAMMGYYLDAGYNVLQSCNKTEMELIPFVRYEYSNTQYKMEEGFTASPKNDKTAITTGLTLKLTKGVVVKSDIQFLKSDADDSYSKTLNMGIGVTF